MSGLRWPVRRGHRVQKRRAGREGSIGSWQALAAAAGGVGSEFVKVALLAALFDGLCGAATQGVQVFEHLLLAAGVDQVLALVFDALARVVDALALLCECAPQAIDEGVLAAQLADVDAVRGGTGVFGGVAVEFVKTLFAEGELTLAFGQLPGAGGLVVFGAAQEGDETV